MSDVDAETSQDEEAHPKGSLFLLALFLLMTVLMWGWAYAELIARGDTMEIERYERWFMIASLVVILGAAAALIISVVGHHAALPEPAGRIAPEDVRSTAPFTEPGLHDNGDGTYDLVLIAQAWSWIPSEVTVPVGAEINLIAASVDVVHGMNIPDTQANAMVIPGQITEFEVVFDEAGTYSLICHEYCGIGHHTMGGVIIAE